MKLALRHLPRRRRAGFASVVVTAAVAAVLSSPADASADTISFADLPVAAAAPKSETPPAPEKIAAGERADGFYAAILPAAQRKDTEAKGYRFISVFTTERDAQAYAADGSPVRVRSDGDGKGSGRGPRTCLTTSGSLSPTLSLYLRTKAYVTPAPSAAEIARLTKLHRWPPKPVKPETPKDTLRLLRSERLSPTPDGVTVDTTDAYLDLNTLAARTVSKSSTHLVRVASGPNGMGIFAARDAEGRSQFLVTSPELPPTDSEEDRAAQVETLQATADRLVAQVPSGVSSQAGCGYTRFVLASKPGAGQMATVLATAFLPPASEADDEGPAEGDEEIDTDSMSEEQVARVKDALRRENRSQRARPVAINVSLSQLESEPSPLLSVTFGWAGADQRLHF